MTVEVYASTTLTKVLYVPKIGDDVVVFGAIVGSVFEMVDMRPAPRTPFGGPLRNGGGNQMMKGQGLGEGRGIMK
jgi:hypothetical protein